MSFKWISFKTTAAFTAALITVSALGAVSPVQAVPDCTKATQNTADCTVITIHTFGDVILGKLKLQYERENPGIKLSVKPSELDALNGQELMTQCLAGGKGNPDIAAVEISYSGLWRSSPQCFTDLRTLKTTVGKKSANDIKKDYLDWRWAHGVGLNGSVIGIPTDVGGLEVAYRWDLFKKKGLPYQRDKVSAAWSNWDKFIDFGKKYMATVPAASKKKNVAFMDNVATIYTAKLNQGTVKYYQANGTSTGKLVYKTNKAVREAFDTTVLASKAGIGSRVGQFSSDWNVGMTKGTFAVMLAPAWMTEYIKGQAPATKGLWDIAKIPGGGGNQGGSQLTIPKGAKNKQAAWDFITWYLAPAQQLVAFKSYGLFPSTPSLYSNKDLVNYKDPFFNGAQTGKIYADGVKKLKPIIEGKLQRCIDMAMGSALSLVINGKEKVPSKAFSTGISKADLCTKK